MKTTLRNTAAALLLGLSFTQLQAQDQSGTFLRSGVSDAGKLINAYMSPLAKGFAQGMNDGWYNTAKPLGIGGFDLRMNLGVGFVPSKDQSYDFNNIGLNTDPNKPRLVIENGGSPNMPTLFGSKQDNPATVAVRARVTDPNTNLSFDTVISRFKMPTGIGYAYTPSLPSAQLSVGVGAGTEVTVRYFPKIQIGDFKGSTFGFGVKHDVKQWIKGLTNQKWDWSVYAAYSTINTEYQSKALLTVDTSAYNPDASVNYNNQKITLNGNAFTVGTLVSIKLGPLTPYVALNYAYSKVNVKFEGNYPVTVPNDEYDPASSSKNKVTKISNTSDPVDIEGKISNMRAAVGLRLKLALITIGGEYSFGQYNTATIGVGINFQSLAPFKL